MFAINEDAYILVAQFARYGFTLIMLVIVWRAVRGLLIDTRRAAKLRRMLPTTGLCGEMVVLRGGEHVKESMRYPVIREGTIGSARRCDIRIRHSTVRRRHAYFRMTGDGLQIRAHANAHIFNASRRLQKELLLQDGDRFSIGHVEMLLVLSFADRASGGPILKRARPDEYEDDGVRFEELDGSESFDAGADPDDLFDTDIVQAQEPRRPAPRPNGEHYSSAPRRVDPGWGDLFDEEE